MQIFASSQLHERVGLGVWLEAQTTISQVRTDEGDGEEGLDQYSKINMHATTWEVGGRGENLRRGPGTAT